MLNSAIRPKDIKSKETPHRVAQYGTDSALDGLKITSTKYRINKKLNLLFPSKTSYSFVVFVWVDIIDFPTFLVKHKDVCLWR